MMNYEQMMLYLYEHREAIALIKETENKGDYNDQDN